MLAILLAASVSGRGYRSSRTMLVCLVVIGIVFYPLAAGLASFDLYELGYRGVAVPGIMLGLVAVGWMARAADVTVWIGLAALLYMFGAYDSNNLWDYLIVPTDAIYGAVVLAIRAYRSRRASRSDYRAVNLENSATTRS